MISQFMKNLVVYLVFCLVVPVNLYLFFYFIAKISFCLYFLVRIKLIEKFFRFGESIGIAFQLKDDLFDYGDADVGKPRAIGALISCSALVICQDKVKRIL